MSPISLSLRWLSAALLLALQLGTAAAHTLLDFSADEKRRIAAHGPWPPRPAADAGNSLSGRAEAIALGKRLFHDTRLSPDQRFSCATCHDPARGFADGQARAPGRDLGDRNTPGLWNGGHQRWFGWDGAADSLWSQSLRAMTNPREMAATHDHVRTVLHSDPGYRRSWQQLFGAPPQQPSELTAVRAAKAMGAYLATLTSSRTAFDQFRDALVAGDTARAARYPLAAQRGARLFVDRAGCAICHVGPLFSNGEFADVGLPFFIRPGLVDPGRHGGIQALTSGEHARFNLLGSYSDARNTSASVKTRHVDLQHRNFGEFKVPGLRELVPTAPYMHDGSLATLGDVVRHYNHINLERLHADGDRILRPLGLSTEDEADLVAFLQSLSAPGERAAGPSRPTIRPPSK